LRDITPDDLCNQAEINHLRGAFIGHIFYPTSFDWGLCSRAQFVYNFSKRKHDLPGHAGAGGARSRAISCRIS
jgi:hypothetical protein